MSPSLGRGRGRCSGSTQRCDGGANGAVIRAPWLMERGCGGGLSPQNATYTTRPLCRPTTLEPLRCTRLMPALIRAHPPSLHHVAGAGGREVRTPRHGGGGRA